MLGPTSIITTVRHGKKNKDGLLEPEGKLDSAKRGVSIEHLKGDMIIFHSGEQRVKDTIAIIGRNIHKNNEQELLDYLETEFDLQSYIVPTLHFLKDKDVKAEYFSNWHGETNEDEVIDFIGLGNSFPEPEIAFNTFAMAKNVANILYTQIKFSALTSEEQKSNFINGSHEPVIMSFLYQILSDRDHQESPNDFINRIGGSVKYTEGFDIKIYQNSLDIQKIILEFRNIQKEITLGDLENIGRNI